MTAPTLTTSRLLLRPWKDDDRPAFAAMNQDPEVMRFFPALQSPETSDQAIDGWRSELASRGWSNWAVEIRDTGQFVGFIGLTVPRRVLPFSPCVELGYRLCRGSWGRGLATEGAVAALRFGFEQGGLEEIVSFTAKLNVPSQAVMRKAGLRDTGQDFEHPAVPDAHPLRPHCLYRTRRDAWRPAGG